MSHFGLDAVKAIAEHLSRREGYELVDVVLVSTERKHVIRVYIHRPGGVSIEDCRRFSEELKTVIEVEGAVREPYVLEVSSPGLTRHLRTPADFRRSTGERIEVSWVRGDGGAAHAEGTIEEADGEGFSLKTAEGSLRISYPDVKQARPLIDWKEIFRAGKKRTHPEE